MAVPDHASPAALRNHSLAGTAVVNPSQTRACATMLALTSHFTATNAKHPRHAPCSQRRASRYVSISAHHERLHARLVKPATAGASLGLPHPPSRRSRIAPVPIISMAMPDHASPVALRNHSLAGTAAVNPSQTRACATMLALTSHFTATNAKHPRHAPCSQRRARWPLPRSQRRGEVAAPRSQRRARWHGWGGRIPGGGAGRRTREWGMISEVAKIHSCSDIGTRNRTRFANVSLGTDDATRGRPPVSGAIR